MERRGNRMVHIFERRSDGLKVAVDVTEEMMRTGKLSIAAAILRENHLDSVYQAFKQAMISDKSPDGEILMDFDRCVVIEPEEFAGKTFAEVQRELAFSEMSEAERNAAIEAEVEKFSEALENDALAAEIDSMLDSRSPMELADAIAEHAQDLGEMAADEEIDAASRMLAIDEVTRSWMAWLGNHVMIMASEGCADVLGPVRDLEHEMADRIEAIKRGDYEQD